MSRWVLKWDYVRVAEVVRHNFLKIKQEENIVCGLKTYTAVTAMKRALNRERLTEEKKKKQRRGDYFKNELSRELAN